MRIDLMTPYEEKDECKELEGKWDPGASVWDGQKGTWYADITGENLRMFKKWIPEEVYSELEKLLIPHELEETYRIIKQKIDAAFQAKGQEERNLYERWICVEGDVHGLPDDTYIKRALSFELIDSYERNHSISVYYNENRSRKYGVSLDESDTAIEQARHIRNKRIIVIGKVEIYAAGKKSKLQIVAENMIPIGECSWIADKKKWEKECEYELSHPKEWWPLRKLDTIYLIARKDTKGYSDFYRGLNDYERQKHTIIEGEPQSMTVDHIIEKIKEANQMAADKKPDCICIVRGGGAPEDLIQYSRPELVKAAYDSSIPVLIGVGHSDDDILCERAVNPINITGGGRIKGKGALPANIAAYINSTWFKIKGQASEKFNKHKRNLGGNNNHGRFSVSADTVEMLTLENQGLMKELDRIKQMSLWRRIFRWPY